MEEQKKQVPERAVRTFAKAEATLQEKEQGRPEAEAQQALRQAEGVDGNSWKTEKGSKTKGKNDGGRQAAGKAAEVTAGAIKNGAGRVAGKASSLRDNRAPEEDNLKKAAETVHKAAGTAAAGIRKAARLGTDVPSADFGAPLKKTGVASGRKMPVFADNRSASGIVTQSRIENRFNVQETPVPDRSPAVMDGPLQPIQAIPGKEAEKANDTVRTAGDTFAKITGSVAAAAGSGLGIAGVVVAIIFVAALILVLLMFLFLAFILGCIGAIGSAGEMETETVTEAVTGMLYILKGGLW